jgi:hypothetical protein
LIMANATFGARRLTARRAAGCQPDFQTSCPTLFVLLR